jgi:hypothetical protein
MPDRILQDLHQTYPEIAYGPEQLRCRTPARLILEIDIRELLPGSIADGKGLGVLLDGPRWREAARRRHAAMITTRVAENSSLVRVPGTLSRVSFLAYQAKPVTTGDDVSDAELIQQLTDQAKQLGIEINLNYSFAQQSDE